MDDQLLTAALTSLNAQYCHDAYEAAIAARDSAIIEAKEAGATWPQIAEATGMGLPNLFRINATQRAKNVEET